MDSQGPIGQLTQGVKAPSACTKAECLQELRSFGHKPNTDLTLAGRRALVKRNRVEHGFMKDKGLSDLSKETDPMTLVLKGTAKELKAFAAEKDLDYDSKASLRLRLWLMRSGAGDTLVTFEKHAGLTFDETWGQDAHQEPQEDREGPRLGSDMAGSRPGA